MNWVWDAFYIAGLGSLGVGAGFYDWRLAAIVVGSVLIVTAILGQRR